MKRTWSPEQTAVFDWFESGTDSLVVRARAGTGKTTTILEGIHHAPPETTILVCAFNKVIATELAAKIDHPHAEALTLHAIGYRIVRRFWERMQVESHNGDRSHKLSERVALGAPDRIVTLISKLLNLGREIAPFAVGPEDLRQIAWDHDCIPDQEWADYGWDVDSVLRAAYQAMQNARQRPYAGIDYSDMIYLPCVNHWIRPTYDVVVVDEAQDMNQAQLEIAKGLARHRVCVVGDDRQGIYGFRGADSHALDHLKTTLKASELPLNTTYRCAKVIVSAAQAIVPDYRAYKANPEGAIRNIEMETLLDEAKPGDAILSRANAPLIGVCLKALRKGIPARVVGKDIAAGLRRLVDDLAKSKAKDSIPELLKRLAAWEEREIHRAQKSGIRNIEAKVEQIQDKADALRTLADGVSGVPELRARLAEVFSEITQGRAITLSSVHKAKGLEWPTVYLLAKTFRDNTEEEQNIEYVAITRAIHTLVWVGSKPPPRGDRKDS